jgi:hypothetical protein
MSAEGDIVRDLAESDPILRVDGLLVCGICAVTAPESAGHIAVEDPAQHCAYRRAVELIYPKVAEIDEDEAPASALRIHVVE